MEFIGGLCYARNMETDTMTNMNLSFPESVREFIEEQVSAYGFGTASEYLRQLVLQDKKRQEQEKLEAMLLKAMEGGTRIEITEGYWDRKKAELAARCGAKAQE
ncbi:MAG: ribbon-helix-helix domain-containing protein [Blastocatellia bacterium]